MKKIILFLGMFMMFNISALASGHLDLVRIDGVYSSQVNMDTGSYFSSNQKKYIIDGRIVYCVEPGLNIMINDYSSTLDLSLSGMSQDVINKISLIGYFGYDYPGHQTDNYFLAAQELIWESIGNNEVHFTTGINDSGNMINIAFEKNEILSLVNHYYLKPSFDSSSVSGIYGDEIVLVDKNNVLSNYHVNSTNNAVSIDGNKLKIKLSSLGDDKIVLSRDKYDDSPSVFYYAPNSQDFMFLRADNVVTSVVNVNSYIPYSNIKISKNGLVLDDFSSDGFVYKNGGLTGVKFGLYAGGDIYEGNNILYRTNDLIEELVTNNGIVTSRNLPNGNYYLKEISTLDDFILNDDVVYVSLDNYKKEVYTYMVDFNNERKNIFIYLQKNGEFFEEIVSGRSEYVDIPLNGVKFGLYSSSDIYDYDNNLIVKKDSLIDTFVTSNGVISEQLNIPFGTYYLKEIETLPGYILDSNIYEFNISGDSNDIKIMVSKEPILNEIIKGNLIINKIDEYGNKLSGACFKLFDELNNLIYSGCTDSDGVISIENLGYGKYHFYEVSAPNGYLVSDKIYDVNVTDDSLIQVDVINVKMPETNDIYLVPRKLSAIGIGFGIVTLSLAVIYGKKNKNN